MPMPADLPSTGEYIIIGSETDKEVGTDQDPCDTKKSHSRMRSIRFVTYYFWDGPKHNRSVTLTLNTTSRTLPFCFKNGRKDLVVLHEPTCDIPRKDTVSIYGRKSALFLDDAFDAQSYIKYSFQCALVCSISEVTT